MGYLNCIKAFEVNKHGLLKIVSISSSRHLFLEIFLGRFFSCNERYRKYPNLVRTQVEIISDLNYLVRILFER